MEIKFKSVGVQAAIIAGIFSVIVAVIYVANNRTEIYKENASMKKLIIEKDNKIKELDEENQKNTVEIQRLETQLIPFKTVALEFYPGPEAEALSKLASRIYNLESSLKSVQDYSVMAQYDSHGGLGGLSFGHPIPAILRGCSNSFTGKDGKPYDTWKCDSQSMSKYQQVIQEYPTFPFTYAVLAFCLRSSDNPKWIEHAKKAKKIFLETTKISGHNPLHDEYLEKITHLLNETEKDKQ
jgi:hypothetical protein